MRHKNSINHLGRTTAHRKAMLKNMATSLIIHKRIKTTLAKAKELKMFVEPIITRSKEDTTHSRRMVFSRLQSKDAVNELFREISVKVASRPGGYTRILKTGNRLGDNAEMCIIELVDYNELMLENKEGKKVKTTRRRRGSKSETSEISKAKIAKNEDVVVDAQIVEEVKETPKSAKPEAETPAEQDKTE
ncbi:MAG: 50S ribosomal protein L17 [Bacteroidetes bacterium CG2_30_33_31]|nr:MAG: 50S ribosomal protein L17 [Bacteroidetes bacterium CG2_30_33_31]